MYYTHDYGFSDESVSSLSVAISEAEWISLIEGQSRGNIITSDKDGKPRLVEPPAPTPEQLIAWADERKAALLARAAVAMAPLQFAEELEDISADEAATLKAWKQYCVAIRRVDIREPDISWPAAPEE